MASQAGSGSTVCDAHDSVRHHGRIAVMKRLLLLQLLAAGRAACAIAADSPPPPLAPTTAVPMLTVANCSDAQSKGWTHTERYQLTQDGGKTCVTAVAPVQDGDSLVMLPCDGALDYNQRWTHNSSFRHGGPETFLLPAHSDSDPGTTPKTLDPVNDIIFGFGNKADVPTPIPSGSSALPISVKNLAFWIAGAEACGYGMNCRFNLSSSGQITSFLGDWCVGAAPAPSPLPYIPHPPAPPPFGDNCSTDNSGVCFSWTCGDHMVLQRAPHKAAVYGHVNGAASTISVTVAQVGGAVYTVPAVVTAGVVAGSKKAWKAVLKPAAGGGNFSITARCTAGCIGEASIADVTFGDIFYCSGQSNMVRQKQQTLPRLSVSFPLSDAAARPSLCFRRYQCFTR